MAAVFWIRMRLLILEPCAPGYANNDQQQNPLWGYFRTLTGKPTSGGQADYYRASAYAINTLNAYTDPRLPFIYTKNSAGAYVGNVLGSQNNIPGEGTSSMGPGLLKSARQNAVISVLPRVIFCRLKQW